jgi:hypothetical protein
MLAVSHLKVSAGTTSVAERHPSLARLRGAERRRMTWRRPGLVSETQLASLSAPQPVLWRQNVVDWLEEYYLRGIAGQFDPRDGPINLYWEYRRVECR